MNFIYKFINLLIEAMTPAQIVNIIDNEPDFVITQYYGLSCVIQRSKVTKVLCGYVQIGPDHPLYGFDFQDEIKVPKSYMQTKIDTDKVPILELFAYMLKKKSKNEDIKKDIQEGIIPLSLAFKVHGGISFSGRELVMQSSWNEKEKRFTENVTNFNDDVWWFGFDCGHAGDLIPEWITGNTLKDDDEVKKMLLKDNVYRDIEYVKGECKLLAKQLAEFQHVK